MPARPHPPRSLATALAPSPVLSADLPPGLRSSGRRLQEELQRLSVNLTSERGRRKEAQSTATVLQEGIDALKSQRVDLDEAMDAKLDTAADQVPLLPPAAPCPLSRVRAHGGC